MLYNGQPSAYALRLQREFGPGIITALESMRLQTVKDFPYEEKIIEYTVKVAALRNPQVLGSLVV